MVELKDINGNVIENVGPRLEEICRNILWLSKITNISESAIHNYVKDRVSQINPTYSRKLCIALGFNDLNESDEFLKELHIPRIIEHYSLSSHEEYLQVIDIPSWAPSTINERMKDYSIGIADLSELTDIHHRKLTNISFRKVRIKDNDAKTLFAALNFDNPIASQEYREKWVRLKQHESYSDYLDTLEFKKSQR
ncbi:hypothetical protein KY321_00425 [Candidatus Woesearchaeota archaeon]|nr:hypothetical protein [Candidatus Woesearchaeota archaeon]